MTRIKCEISKGEILKVLDITELQIVFPEILKVLDITELQIVFPEKQIDEKTPKIGDIVAPGDTLRDLYIGEEYHPLIKVDSQQTARPYLVNGSRWRFVRRKSDNAVFGINKDWLLGGFKEDLPKNIL